jgi:hypothetical protein
MLKQLSSLCWSVQLALLEKVGQICEQEAWQTRAARFS